MARAGTGREQAPPALPPARRPVGQLVAESIRLYQRRFWRCLALGLPLAILDQAALGRSLTVQTLALLAAAPLLTLAYLGACALAASTRPGRRGTVTAFVLGVVVFVPFPLLVRAFILPGLAWFALVGLAVPAALLEGRGFRDALRRGLRLGRADYVHALGGLAAVALVYGVSRGSLLVLLRTQGNQAERGALFLADLVLSPLVFLGAALLYFDQAARAVDSARPRTRRSGDADLRAAVEPDAAGRPDAEVESRPATGGQP